MLASRRCALGMTMLLLAFYAMTFTIVLFSSTRSGVKWWDPLTGGSSMEVMPKWKVNGASVAFCLSSLPDGLLQDQRFSDVAPNDKLDHAKNSSTKTLRGHIDEGAYTKDSIYSYLYAMYFHAGATTYDGVPYEFTFNTWGYLPSPYNDRDPQRIGKGAYRGLVDFPVVKRYLSEVTRSPKMVEVGCGTGAGAHLVSSELIPKAKYLAIDMQEAAINTCKRLHGNAYNSGMSCVHAPDGIGVHGRRIHDEKGMLVEDGSIDLVVMSETHVSEYKHIDPQVEAIWNEIYRILKPGGLYLWGNVLDTVTWHETPAYLEQHGFRRVESVNHTAGAIEARLQDAKRVDAYVDHLLSLYAGFRIPFVGARCHSVVGALIKNFYRHPGTHLFQTMVTGEDSYMQEAYQKI